MLTVGLIKELQFIATALGGSVESTLRSAALEQPLGIKLSGGMLTLDYKGHQIWRESVSDASSMFGIESCQTIYNIIILIDLGDTTHWPTLAYNESA